MKKLIILVFSIIMLCGCGNDSKEDVLNNFIKDSEKIKSYKIIGNMEINNDEETFVYSVESYYLKDNYYKVILVNQTNNHEQIILKNNQDIYVITPTLNKSFKFQSEWPENSSQAYLIDNIVNDLKNDKDVKITKKDNGYVIKSKVDYPNNENLIYQKIYINDKKEIEKVEVFDEKDIIKIKVMFEDINLKAKLTKNDFKLEDYVKKDKNNNVVENTDNKDGNFNDSKKEDNVDCNQNNELENCDENKVDENSTINNNESNTKETLNIENIIYPLYIPSNTFLASSEKIETNNGNRIILTFSGEKNFVLIEEVSLVNDDMEIVPVYGEPLLLSESIGALSANSLTWDVNNISYYLASTELSTSEMSAIANSLGNSKIVSNIK